MEINKDIKSGLKWGGIAIVVWLLSMFISDNDTGTYYYNFGDGGRITVTINSDRTAVISNKFSKDRYPIETKTGWSKSGGIIKLGSGQGSIRDGYMYSNYENAKAKKNGIKLTKQ